MTDTPLRLFNSLTRKLELFASVHPGEARVYTCGPTVYNYPHIGNMRAYIFADTLGRVLRFKGYDLKHVINITDVGHLTDDADAGEDKLEKMAEAQRLTARQIADHYTQAYWADFRALNCREPAHWSIATDFVPRMIEFARGIADKHCYELPTGLYFDTSTVALYGALARATTDVGESRIDPVDGKRNAADFAIWRKTPTGETRQMEWESPWGRGAPGWHLECSVMSGDLLGFPFDIHTGGIDHREIHHPNEIAQNQAHCGGDDSGARIWMHNNFLIDRTKNKDSGKMSKSSGEFLRLQTLVDRGFHPLAYRMMCLQAHYRSEMEFTWEGLAAAFTRLKRLCREFDILKKRNPEVARTTWQAFRWKNSPDEVYNFLQKSGDYRVFDYLTRFRESMNEDLNTSSALVTLESVIKDKGVTVADRLRLVAHMDQVLGLDLISNDRKALRLIPRHVKEANHGIDQTGVYHLIYARTMLKNMKRFSEADAIRSILSDLGVDVMDGDPLGWDWKLDI
jgi:cysteinyl-tRNA synthetase